MLLKSLLIIVMLQLTSETYGQAQKKFFRKDYTFLEETQSFYKFFSIAKTYQEAVTTCGRQGATLFYAEDKRELDAVAKFWTQPRDHIFIGISSLISKGVFASVDGRPLMDVHNDWLPGEPNDVNGEESCIVMNKKGQMNDISCNRKFPFICKKTLASLEWNAHCQTPYKRYIVNEDLGRCYKFFLTPMNWTEAFAVCNAEESYLAIINSDEEANFLKKMTKDNPKYTVKGNYLAGVVMLGFHNRDRQGWLTIKGATLEDSGYTQWGYAQPDVDDKYLCGAMFYNGELTYGDCSQRSFFICEKEYKSGFDERFEDE